MNENEKERDACCHSALPSKEVFSSLPIFSAVEGHLLTTEKPDVSLIVRAHLLPPEFRVG